MRNGTLQNGHSTLTFPRDVEIFPRTRRQEPRGLVAHFSTLVRRCRREVDIHQLTQDCLPFMSWDGSYPTGAVVLCNRHGSM